MADGMDLEAMKARIRAKREKARAEAAEAEAADAAPAAPRWEPPPVPPLLCAAPADYKGDRVIASNASPVRGQKEVAGLAYHTKSRRAAGLDRSSSEEEESSSGEYETETESEEEADAEAKKSDGDGLTGTGTPPPRAARPASRPPDDGLCAGGCSGLGGAVREDGAGGAPMARYRRRYPRGRAHSPAPSRSAAQRLSSWAWRRRSTARCA